MVTQYPHTLEEYQASDAVLGTTGDWSTPDATWVEISKCREEVNGAGSLVKLTDGTTMVYSSLIQLPKTSPVVKAGAVVRVLCNGQIRIEGKVLHFVQDQLHARLWL